MPGNSSHAGIRKIQVQTYLRSSLCCCMGVVAKLFLLWREGKEKSASIFCGYAENGKFFLFSGFNRDKMVVWEFYTIVFYLYLPTILSRDISFTGHP